MATNSKMQLTERTIMIFMTTSDAFLTIGTNELFVE